MEKKHEIVVGCTRSFRRDPYPCPMLLVSRSMRRMGQRLEIAKTGDTKLRRKTKSEVGIRNDGNVGTDVGSMHMHVHLSYYSVIICHNSNIHYFTFVYNLLQYRFGGPQSACDSAWKQRKTTFAEKPLKVIGHLKLCLNSLPAGRGQIEDCHDF